MDSVAIRKFSDEYEDSFIDSRCETDETDALPSGDYQLRPAQWSNRYFNVWSAIPAPFVVSLGKTTNYVGAKESLSDRASVSIVLDDIRRAPFAYARFFSVMGFLMFMLSLLLYSFFQVQLFNPVLAAFGEIGSLLAGLLVQTSLAV
jgi:hypothetical protein